MSVAPKIHPTPAPNNVLAPFLSFGGGEEAERTVCGVLYASRVGSLALIIWKLMWTVLHVKRLGVFVT